MNSSTNDADTYLEISFTSGSLEAGAHVQIQGRFAKNDWSNYTQSNDYSFKAGSQFVEWDQVTAYLNGVLVWGKEPGGSTPTPTPTPTKSATPTPTKSATPTPTPTTTIDPNALTVTIATVEGNVGQNVTIPIKLTNVPSKGIANGDFVLSYNSDILDIQKVEAGDIVINPNDSFDAAIYPDKNMIVFLYAENTGRGTEAITKDGTFAIIHAKVKGGSGFTPIALKEHGAFADNDLRDLKVQYIDGGVEIGIGGPTPPPTINPNAVQVNIATVEGKAGQTVKIPVTFDNVPTKGIANCDFVFSYNPNVLTIVDVEAGDIVINPNDSFDSAIYPDKNMIVFLYAENTGRGTEAIKTNGVFAVITATINAGASNGFTPIRLTEAGGFADNDLKELEVQFIDGGVIVGDIVVPPTPTPTPTPTQTINPNAVRVEIATVNGEAGQTVQIPVTFSNVPSKGIANCDFVFNYDPKVLTIVDVEAGDIVINPKNSFDAAIYPEKNMIVFLYAENTGRGTEAIRTDGVFAVITATINAGAPNGFTPISLNEVGGFADNDLKELEVQFIDGGVNVGTTVVTPTPTPTDKPTDKPTPTPTETIDPNKVAVKIATVNGEAGQTVQIPVTF
ncbi:cohesin domain-containing protein, partial [Acetivibrio straminisolvens]|uniref:cohesin domain-containing protein n=1 Tax=Acetivibrio straminisolvens TaxID=253314 RepID=UPI001FB0F6C6